MATYSARERAEIVQFLLEGGRYASEQEIIDEGLRLLLEHEEHNKLDQLRDDIEIGIEQADRVELAPFDPQATLSRVRSRQAAADASA
jgi:putative addiction module CopG family antidote